MKQLIFCTMLLCGIIIIGMSMKSESPTIIKLEKEMSKKPVLVIHGGAGTILKKYMSAEKDKEYRDQLESVLSEGMELLKIGKSSVDVVEHVIRLMEDSPLFNAGKGAVYNNEGKQEMDASIMSGADLNAGAVAGVGLIKNPITAAKAVMNQSEHVMMTGQGAEKFAKEQGVEIVDANYFHNNRRLKQLKEAMHRERVELDHDGETKEEKPTKDKEEGKSGSIWSKESEKFGTVGAVALDRNGNLAAGTSTGGMTNKRYGRIGDSPIIGAGTYANNATCAVSCTGHGEYFIRSVVAYDVSAIMEYQNKSLEDAAEYVVNTKLKERKGSGGLIAVDAEGNIAMPFNTKGMYRGYIYEDGTMEVKIYGDE